MRSSRTLLAVSVLWCALTVSVHAQNMMSSGTGPGTVTFTVDGWGMWGGCPATQGVHTDATFTPASNIPVVTVCYSAILLEDAACASPGRTLLAVTDSLYTQFPSQALNPAVNVIVPNRHIQTAAASTVCGLQISVEQRLVGPDPGTGGGESSTFVQTYTITNPGTTAHAIKLMRFLDGDLSVSYASNRGGASRRLADCGLTTPPFVGNAEWVFEFDPINAPGLILASGAEGVDANGQPVQAGSYRAHASSTGHPNATFVSSPSTFINNTVDNDLNVDLVSSGSELVGDYAMFQTVALSVPAGGTVKGIFRTRWTSMDTASGASIDTQARDVTCSSWKGNNSSVGVGPLLCIAGQGQCASVPPATSFSISLAAPALGPASADYLVFGIFGQPISGTACGTPQAMDMALWGPPFGPLGLGAFPVSFSLATWSGGGANVGLPLISSLPGIALITGPQATGSAPCGGSTIVTVPGLPSGLSVTLQAAIVDAGGPPLYVTRSNALQLAIGCPCQTH